MYKGLPFKFNIQLFGGVDTTKVVGRPDDLTEDLRLVSSNRAPLLTNLISLGKASGTASSTTVKWIDYEVIATKTTLTSDVTAAATKINVASSEPFSVQEIIAIDEEALLIESINDKELTVTRGYLDTAASTHKKTTEVFLISDNLEEGADLQGTKYKAGKNYDNITQIFREEIDITGTEEALTVPGSNGIAPYDLEQERKFDRLVGKIEKALINGRKFEVGTKRGMGGIRSFLENGHVIDAAGAPISLDLFNGVLKEVYEVGGDVANGTYVFLIPPIQKNNVSKLLKPYMSVPQSEDVLGGVVNFINTDYGMIPLMMSNNLPSSEILLTDLNEIAIEWIPGRQPKHTYMGKKGDSTQGLLLAEASLKIRNLQLQGKIKNIAQTVATGNTPVNVNISGQDNPLQVETVTS